MIQEYISREVNRVLTQLGGPMTLSKVTLGEYDTATGAPSSSSLVDYTVTCALIEYSVDEQQRPDIETGDRKALISTKDVFGAPLIDAPAVGDILSGVGDDVRIVAVRRVIANNETCVFACQVRE